MRLAPQLVLAFGFLVFSAVGGLGFVLRQERKQAETQRFDAELTAACATLTREVQRQAELDAKLVHNACNGGELVDRVAVVLARGDLDENRLRFRELVPRQRQAYDLDEFVLASGAGDVIGADPRDRAGSAKEVAAELASDAAYRFRVTGKTAILNSCRVGAKAQVVGVIGTRYLEPLIARLAKSQAVSVLLGPLPSSGPRTSATASESQLSSTCMLQDNAGHSVPITVARSTALLDANLARLDQAVLLAVLISTGVALVLSVLLARRLGRPLADLAKEASKVARGEARPLKVKGGGEIRELVVAFDKMIEDLAITRGRLAAATRVAAWREVARRVAHEVKNPLAPIRAAVETLRRLKARNDPAFEEYFDEASRTVLDEVHRIAHIVTEFTRFARLPAPRPIAVDLRVLLESVVNLHKTGRARVELVVHSLPKQLRADPDQLVQVVTNLVQNALDAVATVPSGLVTLQLSEGRDGDAIVDVADNGTGIDVAVAERLFEPYATTKANGTGLGLAIAQRIAIEHRGDLLYLGVGAGGRGAVFRLRVPLEGPAEQPPDSDSAVPSPVVRALD
jgi:two-component system, NtrC family, nitrogen regulation sensor histidine kinase NtrY